MSAWQLVILSANVDNISWCCPKIPKIKSKKCYCWESNEAINVPETNKASLCFYFFSRRTFSSLVWGIISKNLWLQQRLTTILFIYLFLVHLVHQVSHLWLTGVSTTSRGVKHYWLISKMPLHPKIKNTDCFPRPVELFIHLDYFGVSYRP